MKQAKRFLVALLAASLAFSMTACGGGNNPGEASGSSAPAASQAAPSAAGSEAPSSAPADEAAVEVSILVSGDNTPNAKNLVLEALGERTNTIINMIYVAGTDEATKRSTMAASDTLPDIFKVGGSEAQEYIDAGLIYDLTGMEDKAPNWIGNGKELIPQMPLNKDGLYIVPTGVLGYADNLNMRTDWLENLGLELPTNLDELYAVYDAFTNQDPNGSGKKDTFGLCASVDPRSFDTIFGAYGVPIKQSIIMEDGSVSSWVKHPHYLEAIQYIRSLINAGFVEPDWLTIPNMDMFGKLWNGVSGAIEWECVGPTNNWMPSRYTEETPPSFGFPIIEGPYGDKGVQPKFANLTEGWCIAARTKNIDAALRLADYFCTDEGNALCYLGVEDVMFKWTDKESGKYEYLDKYADSNAHRAEGGFCYHMVCRPAITCEFRILNNQTREGVQAAWNNMLSNGVVYCYDTLPTRSDYGSDMDKIIDEMYVALLQAGSDGDLPAIYEEYIGRWETEGHGADWEKEITEWYNSHK